MPLIGSNDTHTLESFADLARITVVKFQAERRDREQGDGTLQSLLEKKLPDHQLENNSCCLNERTREKSVIAFRDSLKEVIKFRVEATEMANGVETKPVKHIGCLCMPKEHVLLKAPETEQDAKFSYRCNGK